MINKPEMKKWYRQIQEKLFFMIPEKWSKIYLYASVVEQLNHLQTGEMFFYYFPKGILKKNPVNVYEIPLKFSIEEETYFALADELYSLIKQSREQLIKEEQKPWTNITICIENAKFVVKYNYQDLLHSEYSSYDRHIIWRYKYLQTPIESLNKEDRKKLENYLEKAKFEEIEEQTYTEPIYTKPTKTIIDFRKQTKFIYDKSQEEEKAVKKKIKVEFKKPSYKYIPLEEDENILERQLEEARRKAKLIEEIEQDCIPISPSGSSRSISQILNS